MVRRCEHGETEECLSRILLAAAMTRHEFVVPVRALYAVTGSNIPDYNGQTGYEFRQAARAD